LKIRVGRQRIGLQFKETVSAASAEASPNERLMKEQVLTNQILSGSARGREIAPVDLD